jgi:hypothetical protein
MQSHGGPQLVAELQQCLEKQQATRSVATVGAATSPRIPHVGQLLTSAIPGVSRSASRSPEPTALNLSVTSRHPAKRGRYHYSAEEDSTVTVLWSSLLEHARKMGVKKHQE